MLESYLHFITVNWFTVIITLVVVMFVLNYWTSILEEQLSVIWKKIKIPASVRWATFDAISSSLPEFLTSLVWLFVLDAKWLEVGIGTIWGSAIFNILIIPALVLIFYKGKGIIQIEAKWIKRDSIFYVLSIVILLLGLYFNQFTLMGLVLVLNYLIYIFFLYRHSQDHRKVNTQKVEDAYNKVKHIKVSYLKIILSLILIYVGVEASVVAAEWIGKQLHVSVLIVSLVLLASITSIPDTLLSIKSSQKWDIDAGLSNAVGSNIFDICIGLWIPILIWTLILGFNLHVDFWTNFGVFVFIILSTIIYFFVLSKKNISKKDGLWLLGLYALFILYLVYVSLK